MGTVKKTIQDKFIQELSRGVMGLAVLSRLQEEHYGYSLIKELEQQGYILSQDTLYPLLRRWEEQGVVTSEWKMEEARPRRYYRLSDGGLELYDKLKTEWGNLNTTLGRLLK
jgi:DNA-binding PadR family transcriptional regulator